METSLGIDDIYLMIDQPQNLIFLLAPPAWGKTVRLLKWFERSRYSKMLYLSPLRVLSDEVLARFAGHEDQLFDVFKETEIENFLFPLGTKKKILSAVPEALMGKKDFDLLLNSPDLLIIVDEAHLFFMWASFRPILSEIWDALCCMKSKTIVALSATLEARQMEAWVQEYRFQFSAFWAFNFGNWTLMHRPSKIHSYHQDKFALPLLKYLLKRRRKQSGLLLIFCPYRSQVDVLVRYASRLGLVALGCVGGEGREFSNQLQLQLQDCRPPEVIVGTSVLSHGINLPEVETVFFLSCPKEAAMLLQMIGRGGRQGRDFEVWGPSFSAPFLVGAKESWMKKIKSRIFLIVVYLRYHFML